MLQFSSIKLDIFTLEYRFDLMPYEDYAYEDGFDEDNDELLEDENIILACEDCDYRWKIEYEDFEEEEDYMTSGDTICPMCGSSNVVEI